MGVDWLNYHHLFYFWIVAERGSISEACKELRLAPQTISAQIQTLESKLGEQLFIRQGRGLHLTEVGRVAHRYAGEIFALGGEFVNTINKHPADIPLKLRVGVSDVLPKVVVHQLLRPALHAETPTRLVCIEGNREKLLASLAVHELDLVLADTSIPSSVSVKAFSYLLGECGVSFMGAEKIALQYADDFPRSLEGAPMLLPTSDASLRSSLDRWLTTKRIAPRIVGEISDSALVKVFGQYGEGVFIVPTIVEQEVGRMYKVTPIGRTNKIVERFYAISTERHIDHPSVAAILEGARTDLFAQ